MVAVVLGAVGVAVAKEKTLEIAMAKKAVLLLLLTILERVSAVYIDKSYPYKAGPLSVSALYVTKKENGSPLSSLVTFPATPGNYSVYFFIPGLNGAIFSAVYSDYLSDVGTHGFIVISTDLVFIVDDKVDVGSHFADLYMEQLRWVQRHLQGIFNLRAPGVNIAWENLGIGSHSAGADSSIYIAANNPRLAKAVVLLGPFANNFYNPVNVSLPVLMIQSEFATEHKGSTPPCILKAFGYEHVWDLWPLPPKVKMEAKGFGHCDVLDHAVWETCFKYQICMTTQNSSSLPAYHNFNQGITTAFLNTYVNDYNAQLEYVTNQIYLPDYIDKLMVDV